MDGLSLSREQEAAFRRLQQQMRRIIEEAEKDRESESTPTPRMFDSVPLDSLSRQEGLYHTPAFPASLTWVTPGEAVAELQEALWEWIRELADPTVYDLMYCHDALGCLSDRLYPPQSKEPVEDLQRDLQTEISRGLTLLAQLGQTT